MNIYQRLNKVREAVEYIQKDAKVQGYTAVTHDQVTAIVRPHLIEQGIMVVPRQVSAEFMDARKTTGSGSPYTHYLAMYEIDFVNIEDPTDKVTVIVGSIGEDLNDKGPGKALSYATKNAMLNLLSLETGDSDEGRGDGIKPVISPDQIILLMDICTEKRFQVEATLKRMAKKLFNVEDVDKIPADKFDEAKKALDDMPPYEPPDDSK